MYCTTIIHFQAEYKTGELPVVLNYPCFHIFQKTYGRWPGDQEKTAVFACLAFLSSPWTASLPCLGKEHFHSWKLLKQMVVIFFISSFPISEKFFKKWFTALSSSECCWWGQRNGFRTHIGHWAQLCDQLLSLEFVTQSLQRKSCCCWRSRWPSP